MTVQTDDDYDYDYGEDKDKPIEMHPDWCGEWDDFIDFCLSEPIIKVPFIKYVKKKKSKTKMKYLPTWIKQYVHY